MNRTDAPDTTTFNFVVHIDAERASALWHIACGSKVLDQDGRFELIGGDAHTYSEERSRKGGTVMWCESALEAIVLADYEAFCGYGSWRLWDMAAQEGESGHVVLSSCEWGC